MSTRYEVVRVTSDRRRYRWLTRLLGERIRRQIVFIPTFVEIERRLNQPDRITIR